MVKMMIAKVLLRAARPSFLILTPACVFLGASTALTSMEEMNITLLIVLMLGALAAHVSVNALNEYYDFKSGLDLKTTKTPFNGGSGALPEHPEMALPVLGLGLVMLVIMVTIGVYFIYQSGFGILLIGLMGLALIITYTQWINRLPVMCLIAPGLGFGMFMVVGSHIALVGSSSLLSFAVALVPFFLVNNLLLINQFPDRQADAEAGRYHYPIAFGIEKSTKVYIGFALTAYLLIVAYIATGLLPVLSLMALLPSALSAFTAYGALKYAEHIGEHPPFMAANVAATILTPILLGVSIFIGA
jgi:1,4-dihydroxy-2-naphthoate polyprenyltransferase